MSVAKNRFILVGVAAVLVLSVFTVLAIKILRTSPVVASVAVPNSDAVLNEQSVSGNTTDTKWSMSGQPIVHEDEDKAARTLTVRTAEKLWYQAEVEIDTSKRKAIRKQALTKIQPFLIDPNQNDIAVWRAAGKIALANNDDNLAAYAFEAIKRIKPDYAKDDALLNLMAA